MSSIIISYHSLSIHDLHIKTFPILYGYFKFESNETIHYNQAFRENDVIKISGAFYTAEDVIDLLRDDKHCYSFWVENDEYLNKLLEAGKKYGMTYSEKHIKFIESPKGEKIKIWGECKNTSHVHVSFNGSYYEDCCIYIGDDNDFVFE